MEILFKREQTSKGMRGVFFRLWAMLEVTDDERALIERYDIDQALVIVGDDELAIKRGLVLGLVVAAFAALILLSVMGLGLAWSVILGLLIGGGAAYWWVNEKRETIFMKDLLHGRRFKCNSVVELAKKEVWLENACQALRQVVESAKHWDGVEHREIPVLEPEDAKALIVRAF